MQFVCISRGSLAGARDLAEALARRLGVVCIGREEVIDAAAERGIAIAKLETAVLKPHIFNERLALEKEHFQAFCTAYLLERALKDSLVYHGRAGHLLFPEVDNILRIRVIAGMAYRVDSVMRRLKLDEKKARQYIQDVEDDRKRWVRLYYGVDPDSESGCDFLVNLERVGIENAAAVATCMCQLPDFQISPASTKAMRNMLLAAQSRIALAEDEVTGDAQLHVRAASGVVSVVYRIQDSGMAKRIPAVLAKIKGVKDVVCTMAHTNILWIQEQYDPHSESFHEIVNLANKWNAAVELLRVEEAGESNPHELVPEDLADNAPTQFETSLAPRVLGGIAQNGGVEDDAAEPNEPDDDGGMKTSLAELARTGHSGGGRSVRSAPNRLVDSIDRTHNYTLVVVGNVFLSKGHEAQTRMARETRERIRERLRIPVVSPEELRQRFLFSPKELVKMFAFLLLVGAIYLLIFSSQQAVVGFLHGDASYVKLLRTVCILSLVPVVAYLYGTIARLFLKLLRIE